MTTDTSPYLRELVRLDRRFGVLLGMGVTLPDALTALEGDASPAFRPLIAFLRERVEAGESLADSLMVHPEVTPAIFRDWARLAEETGALDVGAQEIAELLEPLALGGGDLQLGWEKAEAAISLIQFTRRCAELLDKGLEWWRVLYLLEREAPPTFANLIKELLLKRNDERGGFVVLWQRMAEYPQIFSPFYREMIRLGWEAHVMDELTRALSDLLYEDWMLARRTRCYPERASLIVDHGMPPAANWAELTAPQAQLTTILFCRAASHLLTMGFDPEEVLTACALLLPQAQRDALPAHWEHTGGDMALTLDTLNCFPPFITALLFSGQTRGRLEYAFQQAATVLRDEMEVGL